MKTDYAPIYIYVDNTEKSYLARKIYNIRQRVKNVAITYIAGVLRFCWRGGERKNKIYNFVDLRESCRMLPSLRGEVPLRKGGKLPLRFRVSGFTEKGVVL